jgi:hypothetical protein
MHVLRVRYSTGNVPNDEVEPFLWWAAGQLPSGSGTFLPTGAREVEFSFEKDRHLRRARREMQGNPRLSAANLDFEVDHDLAGDER